MRIKILRGLLVNKDVRKSLARKTGNENLIWSWNNSLLKLWGYSLYFKYLSLICEGDVLRSDCLILRMLKRHSMFFPVFGLFGERLRIWPSFSWMIRHTSTCRPRHTVYIRVVSFVCMYVCKKIPHPCTTVWFGVSKTVWFGVSRSSAHSWTTLWSILSKAFDIYKYVARIYIW